MRKIILLMIWMISANAGRAQHRTITGNIINAVTGVPIPGATISTANATSALSSDDGSFKITTTLELPVLMISSTGFYPDSIRVGNVSDGWLIRLRPAAAMLKEVKVSTGYQQLSPEKTTGSFEVIDNKLLNRGVTNNILGRLEGVTSGLFVDRARDQPEFSIRGLSTIRANTQPLIILDNFPYDGNINDIDPDNIDNVTVLRDAGAASIWGAKAANGVIVITSKKGRYNQLKNISFAVNYTLEKKPDLLAARNFMSSADFMGVEQFLFGQGYYDADLQDQFNYPVISPLVELLARQRAGNASQQEVDEAVSNWSKNDLRKDYLKYLYQPQFAQQYSTSMSGGSSNMNYLLGFSYDKTRSNTVGNEGYRGNVNMRINIRPVRKLELQTGIVYTVASDDYNGFNSITASPFKAAMFPYAQLADANGLPAVVVKELRSGYTDTTGAGMLLDWKYRPLEEQQLADNTISRRDMQLSFGLRYDFTKHFSAEIKTQWQQASAETRFNYLAESFFVRDMVNRFTNRGAGNTIIRNIPAGGILDAQNSRFLSGGGRAQLNYNKRISKELDLNALAGAEIRQVRAESENDRTYGWDDSRLSFALVDPTRLYNLWDNLGADVIYSNRSFTRTTNRYVSWFGNAAFTFKEKYLLTASIRKDASNLFGVNTNQKWNPFWSAGAAWKISEEKFYRWKAFSKLNARFTYGHSGNIIPGLSAQPVLSYSSNSVIPVPYASVNVGANPNLRWEQTATLNFGLDFTLKNDRLWGSMEYYTKHSTDLFTVMPLDPSIGIRTQVLNAANLLSRGFNAKISALPVNKKISWQVDLLLDNVNNKVTRFFNESANKGQYVGFGTGITPLEGKDPYAMISYRWAGLDASTGDPRGFINDTISADYAALIRPASFNDLVISGSTRPKWFGSLRNTFSYKSFSLSFNVSFAFAYFFRRESMNYSNLFSGWRMNSEFAERWQQPGDEQRTNVPSMIYPFDSRRDDFYYYSEATVEKGDHIRLRDIQFQYRLNKVKTRTSLLKNAEVSLYLSNLGILWRANNKGLDPAFGSNMPAPLNVSLGLKTNF